MKKTNHFGGQFTTNSIIQEICDSNTCVNCILNENSGNCDTCFNMHTEVVSESIYIKRVIYNGQAVIAFWSDNTKTVAKCSPYDFYDPEKGLLLCYLKKVVGSQEVKAVLDDWVPTEVYETEDTVNVTIADVRKKQKENCLA